MRKWKAISELVKFDGIGRGVADSSTSPKPKIYAKISKDEEAEAENNAETLLFSKVCINHLHNSGQRVFFLFLLIFNDIL